MTAFFHHLGSPFFKQFSVMLAILKLLLQLLIRLPRLSAWRWPEISQSVVHIGLGSLSMVALSTAFAGIMVTHETALHMDLALHSVSMVPGFTGQFILRELGIAIPALLLVSKVGASIAAEIGTMKITEQIDALKLLGIDPIEYLVFPRFIACLISGACLTLIAITVTLGCSISIAVSQYQFNLFEFLNSLRHFIGFKDLLCGLVKGTIYGAFIPVIACTYGFRCQGGAEGVGSATTQAVVTATSTVILLDFLLTYLFTLVF